MYQLRGGGMRHPDVVYRACMDLIIRLAQHGLIHCDFNEFNLLVHRADGSDTEVRQSLLLLYRY
jgi:RIO-like serine/threonine protein kinase